MCQGPISSMPRRARWSAGTHCTKAITFKPQQEKGALLKCSPSSSIIHGLPQKERREELQLGVGLVHGVTDQLRMTDGKQVAPALDGLGSEPRWHLRITGPHSRHSPHPPTPQARHTPPLANLNQAHKTQLSLGSRGGHGFIKTTERPSRHPSLLPRPQQHSLQLGREGRAGAWGSVEAVKRQDIGSLIMNAAMAATPFYGHKAQGLIIEQRTDISTFKPLQPQSPSWA